MSTPVTRTPEWAKGMRKLMPGVYVQGHAVHFSVAELCEAEGVPYNEHNGRMLMDAAEELCRTRFPKAKITELPE